MRKVSRREFVKYAALGIAGVSAAGLAGEDLWHALTTRTNKVVKLRLAMAEALMEMVDHQTVFHWAFEDLDNPQHLPQMPGPLVQATEGDNISLSLTNNLSTVHGFRISGVVGVVGAGVSLAPGETRDLEFTAPPGGSYMYFDHLNSPVNRVLGLQGPMVVLPKTGNTPYSEPTQAVQELFNDLGTAENFPGDPWHPERTRIWFLSSIDPAFNALAERGEPIDPVRFRETFLPRYFTINGLSGAYASHAHDVMPSGRIGQPYLIRIMNAGMAAHSLHIHANHVYVLSRVSDDLSNGVQENVVFIDTFTAKPLERMDWLLPLKRPPDIAGDPTIPLRRMVPQELALTLGGVGQSPLAYPMHCHMEMSQTAAGGNYPQGLVTHWEITGDVDGVDFPESSPQEAGGPSEQHQGGQP